MVGYLRKALKIKKIGHAGTLDPFATGLLIVGIERKATKQLDEFKNLPKTYIATLKLGAVSDTGDSAGKITEYTDVIPAEAGIQTQKVTSKKLDSRLLGNDKKEVPPTIEEIQKVLNTFVGEQEQIPPMYSAKKVKGKKLYELARKGIEIKRKPNKITIYDIKLLEYTYPQLKIEVVCSAGTYIRTLAQDIGAALDVGAYCDELERTKIGEYSVEKAVWPKDVTASSVPL